MLLCYSFGIIDRCIWMAQDRTEPLYLLLPLLLLLLSHFMVLSSKFKSMSLPILQYSQVTYVLYWYRNNTTTVILCTIWHALLYISYLCIPLTTMYLSLLYTSYYY